MKILVPIDFSDYSVNAFQYALALAKDIDAEITLFHAAHNKLADNLNSMITVDDILLKESNTALTEIYTNNKNNIKVTTLSKIGLANDLIIDLCKSNDFDLIVMGSKGATGISKVVFGSVTSSLIQKSKTPILAIPLSAKYDSIKSITIALDLKENYFENLSLVSQIATKRNAEVDVLNVKNQEVKSSNESAILSIEKSFNKVKHSYNFIENNNTIVTIKDFTQRNKTDLLAVISKKHSFIERLFHKSISENLAINITIPLLIIKGL